MKYSHPIERLPEIEDNIIELRKAISSLRREITDLKKQVAELEARPVGGGYGRLP